MKINLSPLNNLQNESTATATINNNNTIITAAVENSISRDGTQPNQMNSELDMNSNKIINLPDAISDQEPVTYGQFVDGITSVNNGVVIDGDFIMMSHHATAINDRVLAAGENIAIVDGGPKGNVEVKVSDPELNAIALVDSAADKLPYFTDVGTAAVADFTPFARNLVDDADATTARTTLGVVIGTDVQPKDADLDAVAGLSTTGLIARTGSGTASTRTITGTANEVTLSNGDGVAGNPTISLPSALTFTGKTVTGGSFSSPAITTPTGIVKGDVGLGNVDNTTDLNKPISTATQTALDDKVTGPASSVSNNVPTFSGLTGKLIQDSGKALPTGTIVGTSDSQALTNKTIVGSSNSISAVPVTSLSITGTPNGLKFLRDDASWQTIPGGGDLLSTNNLSDVASATTSRANLGISDTLPTVQTFTTGSGTYTSPAGCRWIKIKMVGGGGGGASATGASGQTSTGSGGGGAGYVEHAMAAGSYSYAVGAGGAATSNGGNSTFNTSALIAYGGFGTSFTSGAGTGANRSSGSGAGGSASGGNIANIPGCNGENGFRYSGSEGVGARGGNSYMSSQSGQSLSASNAIAGFAGQSYGGGGGGGSSGSTSTATGGSGANGVIIVEEYYR